MRDIHRRGSYSTIPPTFLPSVATNGEWLSALERDDLHSSMLEEALRLATRVSGCF